jgi:hypothetical protein
MPRIRTIKPEFWTDETVGECSIPARLLFIATWNIADDRGNLERSTKQLKVQVFPYDTVDVEKLVRELLKLRLLTEYEVDGKIFLHINGFHRHQKIDRPSAPRCPDYDCSLSTQRVFVEDSSSTQGQFGDGSWTEGKGREGRGKEGKGKKNGATAPVVQPEVPMSIPGLDEEVWQKWVAYRKGIGKPLRPVSFLSAAVDLAKHGANQAAVVEQSIAQGWQGLFPLKQAGKPTKDPRFSIARNFANVDYWEGAKPDDAI